MRAGPYGHIGGGDTRPYELEGAADAYPVNCAKTDWDSAAPWKALWVRSTQPNTENLATGNMGFGEAIEVTRATAFIIINFCYQATEAFTINVNGSIGPAYLGVQNSLLKKTIYTIEGETLDETESPEVESSYDKSYTLPATVFGRFRFELRVNTLTVQQTGVSPRQEITLSATLS